MKRATKRNGKRNRSNRKMKGGLKNTEQLRNIMRKLFRRVFLQDRQERSIPDDTLMKFIILFDGFCKTCLLYDYTYSPKKTNFEKDMENFMSVNSTSNERDEIFEIHKVSLLNAFETQYLPFIRTTYDDMHPGEKYYVDALIDYGTTINEENTRKYHKSGHTVDMYKNNQKLELPDTHELRIIETPMSIDDESSYHPPSTPIKPPNGSIYSSIKYKHNNLKPANLTYEQLHKASETDNSILVLGGRKRTEKRRKKRKTFR